MFLRFLNLCYLQMIQICFVQVLKELITQIETEMGKPSHWFAQNKLSLNLEKKQK